jgi:hypothetical protein
MSTVEQVKPRGLTDVPAEVLLEHLLPALPLKDLTSLSAVNRYFYALAVSALLSVHCAPGLSIPCRIVAGVSIHHNTIVSCT